MNIELELDNYLRYVTVERGLSGNTVAAYHRDLNRYLDWLTERETTDVADISRRTVEEFFLSITDHEPKPAKSSVARVLSSVRNFHLFIFEEGHTSTNPTELIKPPKIDGNLPHPLRVDEVSRLLAVTRGEDLQMVRNRALLEFLYATGARVTEAVALDIDDIGEGVDIVRLRGKGNKERIVPIGSFAREALDTYLVKVRPVFSLRGRETPALFLGARGGRVSRQSAWLIIRAAAQAAGITETVSPHTLRHSFATHMLQGGADVRVVQELLGHSSVATTQIYTQITADSLRDMYSTAHPRATIRLADQ